MRTFLLSIICIFFLTSVLFAQNKNSVSFNDNWKFKLDNVNSFSDDVDDASWRVLNLPHDWSIEGSFDKNNPAGTGGGALPGGIGWYRKTFTIPVSQKNKKVFIGFDGVYKNSEVFINGYSLGIRPNGYISFQYDLTPHLKYGNEKNTIAVKVDNSRQPNSRWYSGSGIYRNVWFTIVNKIHVDHWGVFVTTPSITKEKAAVQIEYSIANASGNVESVRITNLVYDASNTLVAKAEQPGNILVQPGVTSGKTSLVVLHPKLWSIERPYLYRLVTIVKQKNGSIDTHETKFGIRSFSFDAEKGFFLNGKSVKILGVCNHHDLGALGAAINTRALERQLELLKKMGCNGIRTSHNPPAPELLELADRMGFIVMDEAFDMRA